MIHLIFKDGIQSFPKLRELYCSFNKISDLTALFGVPNLEILDLDSNNIFNVKSINFLNKFEHLTHLNFIDNPISKYIGYRNIIGFHLQQIRTLDNVDIKSKVFLKKSPRETQTLFKISTIFERL